MRAFKLDGFDTHPALRDDLTEVRAIALWQGEVRPLQQWRTGRPSASWRRLRWPSRRARHRRLPRRRRRPRPGKAGRDLPHERAVRLATPGVAVGVACEGCPPLARIFEQFAEKGGELLACPFCVSSRGVDDSNLVANARIAGATPLWEWIGDEPATVFSY